MFSVGGEFLLARVEIFSLKLGLRPCKRRRAHATWQLQLKHMKGTFDQQKWADEVPCFPKKERRTGKKHEKHGNVPLIESCVWTEMSDLSGAATFSTNYWMMWWCKFETLYGIWYRKPRRHCIPHHRKPLMTALGIPCNPFEPIHTHRSNGEVPFEECSLQTSSACRFVREPAQVRSSQKNFLDVKASFRCLRLPTRPDWPQKNSWAVGKLPIADPSCTFFKARGKHCLTWVCQPG